MTRFLRLLAALPVLTALVVTLHVVKLDRGLTGCAQAAGTHHAALVVEHANGSVIALCIAFTADKVDGDSLLQMARTTYGLEYATTGSSDSGYGKAVCQVDYEPQQYPSTCWTASSPYWAMFVSRGGARWQTSSLGISSQMFSDGDAEGFRYEGQSDNSTPPSPAGVCPPPATATPPAPPSGPGSAPASTTARPARSSQGTTAAAASVAPSPAPTGVAPVTDPTTTASATRTPAPSVSASPRPAAVALTTPPSPPAASLGAGAWAAMALAAALTALLLARLTIGRRRDGSRAEHP
jgi:hypothetical protein